MPPQRRIAGPRSRPRASSGGRDARLALRRSEPLFRTAGQGQAAAMLSIGLCLLLGAPATPAVVAAASGPVTVTEPRQNPKPASVGATLPEGTRVRTGEGGACTLRLGDGTELRLRAHGDLRVQAGPSRSGVLLSLGRLWTRAVRKSGEGSGFEVRTANAVAGVRGTEFEVGVAPDGSVRVVVQEGRVAVSSEGGRPALVGPKRRADADPIGRLSTGSGGASERDWEVWLRKRAFEAEQRSLRIAEHLKGRLDRRLAKVEELRKRQGDLRSRLKRLPEGPAGRAERIRLTEEIEQVADRLASMEGRVQAVLDTFERWGGEAAGRDGPDAEALGALARDARSVAAGFADLAEEGTDLGEEAMDEMLEEMRPLKDTLRDRKSAREELLDSP